MKEVLYIFIDEAGNFDFSPNGTKFFIIGSLSKRRPFKAYNDLVKLKYDIIESGLELEYFHATEDKQNVRNKVFEIIRNNLEGCSVVATIASKNKTNPALRPIEKFYSKLLGYNIRKAISKENLDEIKEIIIFTDTVPVNKYKSAVEKAVKITLSEMLPKDIPYRIYHHASKSNLDLQITDYITWAIQRKWEKKDDRSYLHIYSAICSEFDLFEIGQTIYY